MNQIDLSTKTDVELKAHAYDVLASIEQYQNVLRILNEEIAKRAQEASKKKFSESSADQVSPKLKKVE